MIGFCDVPSHDDDPEDVRQIPVEIVKVEFKLRGPNSSADNSAHACLKHEVELREAGIIL